MKKGCGIISFLIFIFLLIGGFFGFRYYQKYYGNNVEKEGFVLIPHQAKFSQIMDSISPYLSNRENFKTVALDKNMDTNFKAGRYKIKSGANNTDLVNMIKAGNQTENTFRIGDFFDVYQMVGKVTKKTEIDSVKFAGP